MHFLDTYYVCALVRPFVDYVHVPFMCNFLSGLTKTLLGNSIYTQYLYLLITIVELVGVT